jgi:hypothetical protein
MASHLCPRGIARTEWSKVPVKTAAKATFAAIFTD